MSNYSGYKPDSKIYLIPEPVDFRKSVDGLTMIIQEILKMDPMQKACFMFSNKQHDK
ncbi:MAG: transposase, partial [Clostridium sp.]|nr:transposase [Clostridium sp.]